MRCPKCKSKKVQVERDFSICAACGNEWHTPSNLSPYYVSEKGDLCIDFLDGNVGKVTGVQPSFIANEYAFRAKMIRGGFY